jgi:hypothetical protein
VNGDASERTNPNPAKGERTLGPSCGTTYNYEDDEQTTAVQPSRGRAVAPQGGFIDEFTERLNACTWATDEDAALSIAQLIMAAETPEEVGAEITGRSVTKMGIVGVPLLLRSFSLALSDYEGGPGAYALVDAVNQATGEAFTFSIGGWGPIPQLARWEELEAFPVKAKIIQIPSKTPGYNAAMRFVLL